MEGYHQAEQDLLFGVLDALPCPAALLNREGKPVYVNPKGEACGLPSRDIGALGPVRVCLRGETPPPGWVTLQRISDTQPAEGRTLLSGLAEAYPVRVDGQLLGVLFMLRPEVGCSEEYDALPYASEIMKDLRGRMSRLCALGVPGLFLGEEGTGKAAFARALHDISRPGEPFVTVNCRVADERELERELFGDIPRPGALRGLSGTVYLREADGLSPPFQRRLLALLQNRVFPDGMPFLTRLSVSGPPELEIMAEDGRFDAALYARLSVMPVRLPALRERAEDILPLARHFLRRYAPLAEDPAGDFSDEACRVLLACPWPGNIKMLEDAVVDALAVCDGERIEPGHLPIEAGGAKPGLHQQRQGFTRRRVEEALTLHGRTLEGKRMAARELGIGLSTLYRLIGDKSSNMNGEI